MTSGPGNTAPRITGSATRSKGMADGMVQSRADWEDFWLGIIENERPRTTAARSSGP